MSLSGLRREYTKGGLRRADLFPDPLMEFEKWLQQAISSEVQEANAMTLSTVGADGTPSSRIVLLKGLDARGFVFFTNYDSRKGRELAANNRAALNFYWQELERQICVIGSVSKTPRDESEAYFKSRPLGSRLAAWVSRQSQRVTDRPELERGLEKVKAQYPGGDVPTPPHWGGYILAPVEIEFWQGRQSRLHDRFRYFKEGEKWRIERLSP